MTQKESYEDWQRRLRNDALRLKALAGTTPMSEWVDKFLGIVEREKVRELEAFKEREYERQRAMSRLGMHPVGGRLVEVRTGRGMVEDS